MSTATVNLITAVPGSGKSLYVVQMIDKLLQPKHDADGQLMPMPQIYTNIDGLKPDKFAFPENIHLFQTPTMSGEGVELFDWRDCPDGSIVIYDEAHFFFPVSKQTPEILLELTIARHKAVELFFITQDAAQLHHQIRNLVGNHKHLYNALGAKASTIYEWQHYCANPNSRFEQTRAQSELWPFPRRYFDWYKSANTHTKRLKLPKKAVRLSALALLLLGTSAYFLLRDGGLKTFGNLPLDEPIETVQAAGDEDPVSGAQMPPKEAAEAVDLSKPYAWTSLPAVPAVRGCVANKTRNWCQCFGQDGAPLQMEHAQCLSVLSKPLPFSSGLNFSGGSK